MLEEITATRVRHGRRAATHGHTMRGGVTPTYSSWLAMRARCNNPRHTYYANYGGRGITICDAWGDFEAFLRDVGERPSLAHSLDRINNDGHYEPGNVRWATAKEQARNRTTRREHSVNGVAHTLVEWAEITGIPRRVLYERRGRMGWSLERTISTPVRARRKRAEPAEAPTSASAT